MIKKPKKYSEIGSKDKARVVLSWLEEKQAGTLTALDVTGICPITDVIVVASARTVRHARALADHILDKCREENFEYLGMEGYKNGEWVLLDLNDVLVHVFQGDVREFYNIEGLWSEGTPLA